MVDTHAHLGVCEPAGEELVREAREAGVRRILDVGMDEASNREAIAAAERHEEVFAAVGRHPNSAAGFDEEAAADLEALAAHERVVAIGETGLDYYRDRAPRTEQRRAFEAQIAIARGAGLPLVIHVRNGEGPENDAVADVFEALAAGAAGVAVILHCFSAHERVGEATERGWHCSFAGNVTYPRSEDLRAAAARVPEELLLAETDSPFLAPQSLRGKPNSPARVVEVGERLAEVRGVPYERLEATVEENARRVFQW